MVTEHAQFQGFRLLEQPLVCHGELCVLEGLIKSDGDIVTAEGGYTPASTFKAKTMGTISDRYSAVSLGGFFGRDRRWTDVAPDCSKFTVEAVDIADRPCLFVALGQVLPSLDIFTPNGLCYCAKKNYIF